MFKEIAFDVMIGKYIKDWYVCEKVFFNIGTNKIDREYYIYFITKDGYSNIQEMKIDKTQFEVLLKELEKREG